jgi:hypothetical protein
MRVVHFTLIKAGEAWLTTNELVDRVYPEASTWQQRERHRFAVRKAVAALERNSQHGVRIVRTGGGSDERVRADLTEWTGRHLETPKPRERQAPPEQTRGACRECRCLSFDGSGPGDCWYCAHAYLDHEP